MRELGLRSPSAKVGGIVYFGRLIDKIRRHEKGQLPSDYQGVLWLPYDDSGAWQEQLAKELSAAGIEFDSKALATATKKSLEFQSLS